MAVKTIITAATYVVLSLQSAFMMAQTIEVDLSGRWHSTLGDCVLPGTTDENHLGSGQHPTNVTTQLTRLYPFVGVVEYERTVQITKAMSRKSLSLHLERTKPSTLWVDGDSIGSFGHLFSPHVYQLPALSAGEHTIRIRVDNRDEAVPAGVRGSHGWTDATQTNWNGILGKMAIIGHDQTYIDKVNLYPDIRTKSILVKADIFAEKRCKGKVWLTCATEKEEVLPRVAMNVNLAQGLNRIEQVVGLDTIALWSEFHPTLHTVSVEVEAAKAHDSKTVQLGVREFSTDGTQFRINGYATFMRGTHDGCVFPLTGYCPTDVATWRALFQRAKEYGINHYRFHSYTPTEAAFQAADEEGIYLQVELPLWGTIDSSTVEQNEFLYREALGIIEAYGNHPSFMSLGLGNELWGDNGIMRRWLDDFRKLDARHLYLYGSNNSLGWRGAPDGEDYLVTCRVGGGELYKTNTRTSFSFADEEDGGILNHVRPNTRGDFSYPVSICKRPIVSHETCQFQIYPDYDQIAKYTGVLYPYNLEIFRDRLRENGLSAQQKQFSAATSAWALECYKADIEYCVRTRGFGGYQLLDLKDYPGQGSALCGILDAFMQQKNAADRKVRDVMQPIVPMLLMDKFCWSMSEPFTADVAIANYSETTVCDYVDVAFCSDGKVLEEHSIHCNAVSPGDLLKEQSDCFADFKRRVLADATCPKKITIVLTTGEQHSNEKYRNEYNVWFYPDQQPLALEGIVLADTLDARTISALEAGKRVLLTPSFASIEKQSVGGLFTPDYWNYAMFKTISENNKRPVSPGTLGMTTNMTAEQNALFAASFPNDGYSDWQWWCVAKNSRPLILNSLPHEYRPMIQTVDNVERNHKLGILMEFQVGEGRLLVCTTDLKAIDQYPEGRQYHQAICDYVTSAAFAPSCSVTVDTLRALLYSETKGREINGVRNITDYKVK